MAASASVMLRGRISSISLRASAVRFAWAIKPTTRWPLSNQAKDGTSVSRLNAKKVETKVAVSETRKNGIAKFVRGQKQVVETGASRPRHRLRYTCATRQKIFSLRIWTSNIGERRSNSVSARTGWEARALQPMRIDMRVVLKTTGLKASRRFRRGSCPFAWA
jgi:hypothetical protein